MTLNTGLKMGAAIIVAACLISVSFFAFMHEGGRDETHGPLTSPIFKMEERDGMTHFVFKSDYRFDDYLDIGSSTIPELATYLAENVTAGKLIELEKLQACSAFKVENVSGDGFLTGRNFDYRFAKPAIVHTHPDGGYSSVSIVSLSFFEGVTESDSIRAGNTLYNALLFIPLDGVNEKGVFVCVNIVSSANPIHQNTPGKVPIFLPSALRLILDNAATTQEAIDLVMNYNLNQDDNCHLLVCDKSGDSRTIEIVDNRMVVTPTSIMTNHYITEEGKNVPVTGTSGQRFDTIETALESKPNMSVDDVKTTLKSVSMFDTSEHAYTRWSSVYDLNTCSGTVWIIPIDSEDEKVDYETPYGFSI